MILWIQVMKEKALSLHEWNISHIYLHLMSLKMTSEKLRWRYRLNSKAEQKGENLSKQDLKYFKSYACAKKDFEIINAF